MNSEGGDNLTTINLDAPTMPVSGGPKTGKSVIFCCIQPHFDGLALQNLQNETVEIVTRIPALDL
jgi:hypothetical protein